MTAVPIRINLPNQITIGRLVLAVVFFAVLSYYDHSEQRRWLLDAGLILFIIAATTDALDGYLARKYNQVTSLGRILDPFVDKVLVCGTFIILAGPAFLDPVTQRPVTAIYPWMLVVIVGRELLVSSLRSFCEARDISFGASFSGKAKMIVQSVVAPVLLFLVAHPGFLGHDWTDRIKPILVWITVLVTLGSMSSYLWRSKDLLREASTS